MPLPHFKYHPDPITTGSIESSDAKCLCCGEARGFIYTGPVYAEEELIDRICPWCIADGSAHRQFNAEFVDQEGVRNYGSWEPVPQAVVEEVTFRTPGFAGWQQERWWTHCGDAAEFLGRVGREEAQRYGPEFLSAIRSEAGLVGDLDWEEYLQALHKDGSPTAYVFRCRHCGRYGGYSDCD
jgi:uncharacterized protein CbrC (UPF0167 family)